MPVCHKRKLAFCHIPRTGGVSVNTALRMQIIDKHYPASWYRENFSDYTLFTIIRPYEDRVKSALGWRIPERRKHKWDDFDTLVSELLELGDKNLGLMLKPNEYFLDCKVDYQLRHDHLQDDLNDMLKKLGHKPVKLQRFNSFKNMSIIKAIQDAENLSSKIDGTVMGELMGLSAPKVRHLLNNLAAGSDTYLEVGCYLGGTLRAALHSNKLYSAAVDNFCLMPNKRQMFFDNTSMLEFDFFEEDCFAMDVRKIKKPIGLYFYDGEHSFESQYKALVYFYQILKDEFVYVCDDWAMKKIPNATFSAAKDLDLEIVENYNLLNSPGKKDWWNGIGVVRFEKRKTFADWELKEMIDNMEKTRHENKN
jgi:hypothetical protein